MSRPRLAACCIVALAAPGCGLLDPGALARDASQVLQAGVGVSVMPGLHVHALAPLFGTSLGYLGDGLYLGSDYGYAWGWHQASYGVVIGGEQVRAEFGQSVEEFSDRPLHQTYASQSQMLFLNLIVTDERIGRDRRALSLRRLEVGVHLLVVGAMLGLDLVELFDFLAGLTSWDPAGDDDWTPRHAPFAVEPEPDTRRVPAAPPQDAPPTDDTPDVGPPRDAASAGAPPSG